MIIKAVGMWEGPFRFDNLTEAKPIFTLETRLNTYWANSLNEVLSLWRASKDVSQVINLTRTL